MSESIGGPGRPIPAASGGTTATTEADITPDVVTRLARRALVQGEIQTMTDQTAQPASSGSQPSAGGVSRRGLFRAAGVGAAVLGGGSLLEACSSGTKGATTNKTITIGWIHPLTGTLAGFGAPDHWVISQIRQTTPYKNGFKIGGTTYDVVIKSYDTQSSSTRAGDLAKQAIQQDNVDMLFASSTPETVNAVASQAETLGTPLVCSNIPWESWYLNLGGNPQKPTLKPQHTVMYFLGAEHLVQCFIPMWNRIGAKYGDNHLVAAAFPDDSDGNAFRAVFPLIAKSAGYKFVLSSAYRDELTNYSPMISQFKSSGAGFFTNVLPPPDFATMWTQSLQQGFKPKLATVAKVLLFPGDAYEMGNKVHNVATDSWWVPSLPWHSSFTQQSCQELADAYTAAGNGQPNANISNYTLFEIAYKAFTSVNDPHNKAEVATALHSVVIPDAVAGPMDFTSSKNPAPGVVITPPVGIQWQKGTKYPLEAVVVDNSLLPQAKITGELQPTFK
jgi:branched-chain amino acid transport system substrate-binding protein